MSDKQSFAFEAMDAEGLSVSREDGAVVVYCEDHDGRDTIQMTSVFSLANDHGLKVVDGEVNLDSQQVALTVAENGWTSGDDS